MHLILDDINETGIYRQELLSWGIQSLMLVWFVMTATEGSTRYHTSVAVVPISVPTSITTSIRSSIHFIEKPPKSHPFRCKLLSVYRW